MKFLAPLKTVRVKNKGAFVVKIGLGNYKSNLQNEVEIVNLMALQTHEFKYPIDSVAAIFFVNAIGAVGGNFYVELITDKRICIDVYGTVFSPKATRMNCD